MSVADEFDPKKWIEMISTHGHGGHIGLAYHGHGDDWVELALPWRQELVGDTQTGILASGPIISMMDNATSLSVWARLGTFRPQVTLDLRVDYMRAAEPEKTVYGRGECYQIKRSIAFVRGIAHHGDPEDPIAHVAGTFINMDTAINMDTGK